MGLKTQEAEIDGHRVAVTQLGFERARSLFARLRGLLGPAIARALAGSPASLAMLSLKTDTSDLPGLGAGMELLFTKLDADEERAIADELLSTARVDGHDIGVGSEGKAQREVLFQGDLGLYYKILWFSLRVNFGKTIAGFFDKLTAPPPKAAEG